MSRHQKPTAAVLPISNRLPEPTKAVVPLDQIDPSPFNKRVFSENDPRDLELTDNLRATGRIIEPLLVRPDGGRFRLIAGERRLRSGREAGLVEADVMIYDVDEQTANLMTFIENRFRKDLHYLEEAAAVEGLLSSGLTQEMIAAQIGMPVKWVALRARLSNLSGRWRELALSAEPHYVVRLWSASHLEVIALLGQEAQDDLLSSHAYLIRSEPSVPELRGLVSESTRQLAGAPWRLDDDSLCPQAGACSACTLRTSVHPMLFEDLIEETSRKDSCLNSSCWGSKMTAFLARREAELRQSHPELVLLTTGSTRQDGAIAAWSVRPAKKNQPGAVPALVLDGSDRGKLRWVVPPEPAKPVTTISSAELPAPVPGQRAKTPLAIRRAALDRRRKLLATETIAVAVAESEQVPSLAAVLALTCVFGTEHTLSSGSSRDLSGFGLSSPDGGNAGPELPLWGLAEDLSRAEVNLHDLGVRLWRRVRPVLVKRTANIGTPEDILRAYDEACKLAALVGVDSAQHLSEAAASLPDPRSWAEEEAAMVRASQADAPEAEPVPIDPRVPDSSGAQPVAA